MKNKEEAVGLCDQFIEWTRLYPLKALLSYTLVVTITTIFLVPNAWFALLAAYLFTEAFDSKLIGFFFTFFSTVVSLTVGGYCIFLLTRHLFEDCLQPYINRSKYLSAMNLGIQKSGFKLVALLRVSPTTPETMFNIFLAMTSVSNRDFLIGSLLGCIPRKIVFIIIYVNVMTELSKFDSNKEMDSSSIVILVIGIIIAILIVFIIGRVTNRELKK